MTVPTIGDTGSVRRKSTRRSIRSITAEAAKAAALRVITRTTAALKIAGVSASITNPQRNVSTSIAGIRTESPRAVKVERTTRVTKMPTV
jgi:hypothetical protein